MENHTATDIKSMSIYERIDAAFSEVAAVKFTKSKKVITKRKQYKDDTEEGYLILSIADILDPIRKIHGKYGVKLFFGVPEYNEKAGEGIEKSPTRSGAVMTRAHGHISYKLVGRDDRDSINGAVPFEAQDQADKLTNKIITNAERTLYRVLYAIDGDDAQDPEETNTPTEAPSKAVNDPFFNGKGKDTPKESEAQEEPTKPVEAMFRQIKGGLSRANTREVMAMYLANYGIKPLDLIKDPAKIEALDLKHREALSKIVVLVETDKRAEAVQIAQGGQ